MSYFKYVSGIWWAGWAVQYAETTMADKLETGTEASLHRQDN